MKFPKDAPLRAVMKTLEKLGFKTRQMRKSYCYGP